MLPVQFPRVPNFQRPRFLCLLAVFTFSFQAAAQSVTITSPTANSSNPSAVQITAYASNEPPTFDHYEIWDTNGSQAGYKLGTVPKTSTPNAVYVLPNGTHTLSVLAVDAAGGSGGVLNQASVTFTVAESCTDSSTVQCNLDQLGIQNPQSNCNPPQEGSGSETLAEPKEAEAPNQRASASPSPQRPPFLTPATPP